MSISQRAIVSMLYVTENGATAEIGLIGNDGLSGHALFLGGDTTTSQKSGSLKTWHFLILLNSKNYFSFGI